MRRGARPIAFDDEARVEEQAHRHSLSVARLFRGAALSDPTEEACLRGVQPVRSIVLPAEGLQLLWLCCPESSLQGHPVCHAMDSKADTSGPLVERYEACFKPLERPAGRLCERFSMSAET